MGKYTPEELALRLEDIAKNSRPPGTSNDESYEDDYYALGQAADVLRHMVPKPFTYEVQKTLVGKRVIVFGGTFIDKKIPDAPFSNKEGHLVHVWPRFLEAGDGYVVSPKSFIEMSVFKFQKEAE